MSNELLLSISVFGIFSAVLLLFKLFGKTGLFAATVFATITANIEVLILIDAFGMEQTLGNILFAATFLCTDIASELYGRRIATKIVNLGILTSIFFIMVTQSWLMYTVSQNDWVFDSINTVFSNTPRMMFVGLAVYAISQKFDVFMFEYIWQATDRQFGNHKNYLWLRNNGSTLISQLLNSVLFTFGAFYGTFDMPTLISITKSSYIIFVVLALVDTFFVYMARALYQNNMISEIHK